MKKSALISFGAGLLTPVLAFAQEPQFNPIYAENVIKTGRLWLGWSLNIIMVLMTLWFLIGVFRYIAEKDPGKLADKRKVMINGLIGLFVAVSVWGIVRIFQQVTGTTYNDQNSVNVTCPPGTYYRNGGCF